MKNRDPGDEHIDLAEQYDMPGAHPVVDEVATPIIEVITRADGSHTVWVNGEARIRLQKYQMFRVVKRGDVWIPEVLNE